MKAGLSRLFDLQPDPYDFTQHRYIRLCLFRDVQNAKELGAGVRDGQFDAALIRPELVFEPFVVLAAANRAIHQAAHNRLTTRSLSAELIYSLSPNRNIADSLRTFGIADTSRNLLVAIFHDETGDGMKKMGKLIDGRAVPLEELGEVVDLKTLKKVYKLSESQMAEEDISGIIVSKLVTKDYMS
uniref:EKC/KEOPS complex subunit cgi121 n=1 Tax=Steinernema glaseri TaxID=37863 RepID=A0A1I7YV96_9BILA